MLAGSVFSDATKKEAVTAVGKRVCMLWCFLYFMSKYSGRSHHASGEVSVNDDGRKQEGQNRSYVAVQFILCSTAVGGGRTKRSSR